MKKITNFILSSITLFCLISCGTTAQSCSSKNDDSFSNHDESSNIESTSSLNSSSEEEASSSAPDSSSDLSESSNIGTYYHVTFLNYDETILYETDVLEGHEAIYEGETPTRPEDDEFTYEFVGWDKDLKSIASELITTATYDYVAKENWGSIIWF